MTIKELKIAILNQPDNQTVLIKSGDEIVRISNIFKVMEEKVDNFSVFVIESDI